MVYLTHSKNMYIAIISLIDPIYGFEVILGVPLCTNSRSRAKKLIKVIKKFKKVMIENRIKDSELPKFNLHPDIMPN